MCCPDVLQWCYVRFAITDFGTELGVQLPRSMQAWADQLESTPAGHQSGHKALLGVQGTKHCWVCP